MDEGIEEKDNVEILEFMVGQVHHLIDLNLEETIINSIKVTKIPNTEDNIKGDPLITEKILYQC